MTNDNYPVGAANDINAPYNEPLNVEHKRFVSVTISYYDKVYLPKNATEAQIKEELRKHVKDADFPECFNIDEFIILDD